MLGTMEGRDYVVPTLHTDVDTFVKSEKSGLSRHITLNHQEGIPDLNFAVDVRIVYPMMI